MTPQIMFISPTALESFFHFPLCCVLSAFSHLPFSSKFFALQRPKDMHIPNTCIFPKRNLEFFSQVQTNYLKLIWKDQRLK